MNSLVHPDQSTDALTASKRPTVSLLVCTVDRSEPLLRLFDSLVNQSCRDFEVVVVDQNPPGRIEPILAKFKSQLLIVHCQAGRGLSRARNVGLQHCRGELLAFPDDDCWYPPDVVERVVGFFRSNPDIDVHSGRTLDPQGREALNITRSEDEPITRKNVWFTVNSNSLFTRTRTAKLVGGFDESLGVGAATPFKSGEECDFVLRMLAAGALGFFHHDLVVHHDRILDDEAAMLDRAKAYAPGFGRILRIHRYGRIHIVRRLLRIMRRGCLAGLRRDFARARFEFAWAKGTARGYFSRLDRGKNARDAEQPLV